MAVVSGKEGTVQACGDEAGGERGEVEGGAGTEGHWTAVTEMRRAQVNAALNMSVASGGNAVQC